MRWGQAQMNFPAGWEVLITAVVERVRAGGDFFGSEIKGWLSLNLDSNPSS